MRRIIFIHTQGPFAGLYEIMGTDENLSALPEKAEDFPARDRLVGRADLVKTTNHAAFYLEYREASDSDAAEPWDAANDAPPDVFLGRSEHGQQSNDVGHADRDSLR